MSLVGLAERGVLPDALIRLGIRRLNRRRLRQESVGDVPTRREALLAEMRESPIAVDTAAANEQHYELPPAFFERVLGPRLKYSACTWTDGVSTLAEAEEAALALVGERARLEDGMTVLDLGCGWGSFTLWAAENHPGARILSVSNSAPQRAFIERRCRERGLDNVEVRTADVNAFDPGRRFDRIVSIEMLEHVRNHARLFGRIAGWLEDDGRFFVHVFAHRHHAYRFDTEAANWIGRYFFTGGLMPSHDLFLEFQDDLEVEGHWWESGVHYSRTAEAWLVNLDAARDAIRPVFEETYGPGDAARWIRRWRIFFLACAELWGHRGGEEWGVSHFRFRRR